MALVEQSNRCGVRPHRGSSALDSTSGDAKDVMAWEADNGIRRSIRLMCALLWLLQAPNGTAQQSIQFIGIKSNADSDKLLRTFLAQHTNLQFQTHTMALNAAVRRLSDWNENKHERYLAHMTPYACVAAEMLGANFEILATYMRKPNGMTPTLSSVYHSFFVVNQDDVRKILGHEPDLTELPRYLEKMYLEKQKPARFIYHDKFSTSSFFLPSLYFRDSHISSAGESSAGSMTPIAVEKPAGIQGSSSLVEEVAGGGAQLAAVWDATVEGQKVKYGDKVYFIKLPSAIPNDLLVLSRLPGSPREDPVRHEILKAIQATEVSRGKWNGRDDEYQYWVNIKDAPEALDALGDLRRMAATAPHYVTVSVRWSPNQKEQPELLQAVEHGIRLSGTEFVSYDKDFHKRVDVTWKLESTHDGAIVLTSQIGEQGLVIPQRFSISFMSPDDLTTRVAALVVTRMHRIRYVWPYQDIYPVVIRDLEYRPQPTVVAQRIVWTDSERNEYEEGIPFESTIVQQAHDFNKFQLRGGFPLGQEGSYQFDPMSNVAYRVILKRAETEEPLFGYLTWALVGLLALLAVGFAWDMRRKQPPPVGFPRTYQAMINEYHKPWHDHQIREADVLWCDPQIDQFINQFRGSNPFSQEVGKITIPGIHLSIAAVQWVFHRMFAEKLKTCA
jgi:ABC-type phosphate/phosphonate transport system substrate-binding protein